MAATTAINATTDPITIPTIAPAESPDEPLPLLLLLLSGGIGQIGDPVVLVEVEEVV